MTAGLIQCPALKSEKVNDLRCKMIQKENIKLWGDRSQELARCPCDQREKMVMVNEIPGGGYSPPESDNPEQKEQVKKRESREKIGTCPECRRPDMRLYGCKGRDLCGRCKNRHYRPVVTTQRKPKPPMEIVADGAVVLPDNWGAFVGSPERERKYDTPAETEQIILKFLDKTDAGILEFLQAEAIRCRRTIDQQIMWILQAAFESRREIT